MSTRVAGRSTPMRKAPKQARSRATVEAIVDAGARVLGAGWAGFTTNKVAETAGVSIGSLYQYFPDKASLVAAIREQHLDDCLAILRRLEGEDLPGEQLVLHLVRGMIAVHDTCPGLHRVLLEEVPEGGADRLDPRSVYEREYLGCYATLVSRYLLDASPQQAETMAITISDAIDGVIHNATRRRALRQPQLETELMRLVQAYLACNPAPILPDQAR